MSVRHYLMLYISLTIMKLIRRTACFPSACGFYQSLFPFMVLKPTLNYSVYIIKTHGPSYKKKSEISICWSSTPRSQAAPPATDFILFSHCNFTLDISKSRFLEHFPFSEGSRNRYAIVLYTNQTVWQPCLFVL